MKNETVKTGMKIGATIGGLVFLVFGIMPGFYFGSFGTLILLQKLMGGAVEPTLIVQGSDRDGDRGRDRLRGSGEPRGRRPARHGDGLHRIRAECDEREGSREGVAKFLQADA